MDTRASATFDEFSPTGLLTAMEGGDVSLSGIASIEDCGPGDRVIASGQTGVLDHLEICDDVVLLHRAGVVESIDKPGMYAGLPLQPLSSYMKTTALMRKLAEMRKKIRALEKNIPGSTE
jgi:UDP-3-O-[3-hydroxymyristoyl] glucosamine N-acyltransferase